MLRTKDVQSSVRWDSALPQSSGRGSVGSGVGPARADGLTGPTRAFENEFQAQGFSATPPPRWVPQKKVRTPWIALVAGWFVTVVALPTAIAIWFLPNMDEHHHIRSAMGSGGLSSEQIGRVIGMMIPALIGLGLGNHVAKRTGKARGRGLERVACMAMLSTLIGLTRPMWDEDAGRRSRAAAGESRVDDAMASALSRASERSRPGVVESDFEGGTGLGDHEQRQMEFMRRVTGLIGDDDRTYQAALDESRLHAMLLTSRLDSPREIKDSQERLARLLEALDEYERSFDTVIPRVRAATHDLFANDEERLASWAAFEDGVRPNLAKGFERVELERAALEEVGVVLELMLDSQRGFTVESGLLVFEEDWRAFVYQYSIDRINAIGEVQMEREEEHRDHLRRCADALSRGVEAPQSRRVRARGTRELEIEQDAVRLGGVEITTRTTERDLIDLLGSPERQARSVGERLVWNQAGIVADFEGDRLITIAAVLHDAADGPNAEYPERAFTGPLRFLGAPVTWFDSPLSVSRGVERGELMPGQESGDEWLAALPGVGKGVFAGVVARADSLVWVVYVSLNEPRQRDEVVTDAGPLAGGGFMDDGVR